MKFWLGTHLTGWLKTESNLFVSRRRLTERKRLPRAAGAWALDSGGFTELNLFGEWVTSEDEYVADVERFVSEIGNLEWVAPMDWMCEPAVLAKTGLDIATHQRRTVENFLRLRDRLGNLVIPVLQGWERDDYLRCVDQYASHIDLTAERLVGVGTVCRRQNTQDAANIFRALDGLRLHGFGIKVNGLSIYRDALVSADSLAWSYQARRNLPMPGCKHKHCQNCLRYARRWRKGIDNLLNQTRMEFA